MRRASIVVLFVITVLMAAASVAPVAVAAGNGTGNPVIDYLEKMVQPALNAIQSEAVATGRKLASIESQLTLLLEAVTTCDACARKVVTVESAFDTYENDTVGVNFDFEAALPRGKTRRYTVTVYSNRLFGVPPETAVVEVKTFLHEEGVGDVPVTVSLTDPALRSLGIIERPFTGTSTLVRVTRGADGLGTRRVFATAYIELAP